jgi:hypothetical protein
MAARLHDAGFQLGAGSMQKIEDIMHSMLDYYAQKPDQMVPSINATAVIVRTTVIEKYLKDKGLAASRRRELVCGVSSMLGYVLGIAMSNTRGAARTTLLPGDVEQAHFVVWNLLSNINMPPAAPAASAKKTAQSTKGSVCDVTN